jgi:hypothetical protein
MGTVEVNVAQAVGSKNPAGVQVDGVASDATNNHYWALQEGDILVAYNKGVSPVELTLNSVADAKQGRTQDPILDIAAGSFGFFGPFKADGWKQTGGEVDFDIETDTDVELAVIRTAGTI